MTSIYKHFSDHVNLPIELKEIKDFILNTGEVTLITRYPVDIDDLVLHGMLRVFRDRPPYASEDRIMAQIAYHEGLDEESIRLVCCKEMLHLLDNHHATASTEDEVAQLVEEITLPFEAVASIPGLTDHTKLIHALCVLVPKAALDVLIPAYENGDLSAENVAQLAKIPEPFARTVLSSKWRELAEKIEETE